jgi:hypothetical protein
MRNPAKRAEEYRERAEELRVTAGTLRDSRSRGILLRMAADYLQMADMAEQLNSARTPDLRQGPMTGLESLS